MSWVLRHPGEFGVLDCSDDFSGSAIKHPAWLLVSKTPLRNRLLSGEFGGSRNGQPQSEQT